MLGSRIESLILDMDGVLWIGEKPIGNLQTIFQRISNLGLKIVFATNNATLSPFAYIDRLAKYKVEVKPEQIVTSAHAMVCLLKKQFPTGCPVFAVGEKDLLDLLSNEGYPPLDLHNSNDAQAVVVGIDRNINFNKMAVATLLVGRGIPFYATNPDRTFPTPQGLIPGAGAWISVIVSATNINPQYAGKPEPFLFEIARERLGTKTEATLVVGDRLSTDIAGGQAAGMQVALVLSGVSTMKEAQSWTPKIDIITKDLNDLITLLGK